MPLVVRLEGTNVARGKEILAESGLNIVAADGMADGAQKIVPPWRQHKATYYKDGQDLQDKTKNRFQVRFKAFHPAHPVHPFSVFQVYLRLFKNGRESGRTRKKAATEA